MVDLVNNIQVQKYTSVCGKNGATSHNWLSDNNFQVGVSIRLAAFQGAMT